MWLLLACSGSVEPPPPAAPRVWTDEAVHSGVIQVIEPGADEISEAAWDRSRWLGPSFLEADLDGSRGVGARELARLIRGQDPLDFDERKARGALDRADWAAPFAAPAGQRATWETLAFLAQETRHLGGTTPDDAELRRLAQAGSLAGDEVQDALAAMKPAWERAGRDFPEGLVE